MQEGCGLGEIKDTIQAILPSFKRLGGLVGLREAIYLLADRLILLSETTATVLPATRNKFVELYEEVLRFMESVKQILLLNSQTLEELSLTLKAVLEPSTGQTGTLLQLEGTLSRQWRIYKFLNTYSTCL